jgi:predicted permease
MRDDELDEELRSHLELQARKHMAAGMSEAEARRRARIEFGGMDLAKEQCRDLDPWRHLEAARRGLKHATRSLIRSPAFSLTAILILALGIGATVAVFSVLDALLFRPLPVHAPDELVRIASVDRRGRLGQLPNTILDPLQSSTWLRGLCGFDSSYEGVEANGILSSIGILGFTGDCFQTLGIATQLGRAIVRADDQAGAESVAVITAELWRTAYGGGDVVGQRVAMPGASFTIVGVTEDRFRGLLLGFPAGLIIPLHQEPSRLPGGRKQDWWSVNVIGRRRAGVSARQANAALAAQSRWLLEQSVPPRFDAARRRQYVSRQLTATPAATGVDYFIRNRFGEPLFAIFGICAAILAIACVNLANLMLARALRRHKEVAVRLALGATRAHVARTLTLESSLLVGAGAALSVVVTMGVNRFILAQGAEMFSNFNMSLGFDARVALFFAATVAAILGGLAGASAWQAGRLCRSGNLRESGNRVMQGSGAAQRILLAAQISLTLALVASGALFGSSLRWLNGLDLGVRIQGVWDVMLGSRPAGHQNFAPGPYYRNLVRQAEAIPGVASVVLTDFVPYLNSAYRQPVSVIESSDPGQEVQAHIANVTDGFFSLMGMRIEEGSDFHREDAGGAEPGAIVSRALAEHLGGAAIIGRHIRVGASPQYQRLSIIGIASDAQLDLVDPSLTKALTVYIDSWQHPLAQASYPVLLVRTAGGSFPAAMMRQMVDRAGREYVQRVRRLDAEKDGALVENRVMAYLAGAFGVLALVLAAVGLFGLLSYQVASRTGEIGIRMALGARTGQIQWLIVRQTAGLLAAGCALGLALTIALGKAMAGLLFGVRAGDPELLAISIAVLAATALIAAWLPARRAAAVDPLVALRHE